MAEPNVTVQPTSVHGIFTDGSDFEPLWSLSQDFGGELRFWHQSGYGSLRVSDVRIVNAATARKEKRNE